MHYSFIIYTYIEINMSEIYEDIQEESKALGRSNKKEPNQSEQS